jgi:ubiquinone/menaquinone biosynthesis C-methylase UbiE
MAELASSQGQNVTILALDFQMETLQLAQEATSHHPNIIYIRADARKLPFAKKSVDAVTCSLALHHFSDADAKLVLTEMARVGRQGLACVDLVRSQFAAWCIWLLTTLVMTNRMTVHDARLSVRRAFSRSEMSSLIQQAGWAEPGTFLDHWKLGWFRQAVIRRPVRTSR